MDNLTSCLVKVLPSCVTHHRQVLTRHVTLHLLECSKAHSWERYGFSTFSPVLYPTSAIPSCSSMDCIDLTDKVTRRVTSSASLAFARSDFSSSETAVCFQSQQYILASLASSWSDLVTSEAHADTERTNHKSSCIVV